MGGARGEEGGGSNISTILVLSILLLLLNIKLRFRRKTVKHVEDNCHYCCYFYQNQVYKRNSSLYSLSSPSSYRHYHHQAFHPKCTGCFSNRTPPFLNAKKKTVLQPITAAISGVTRTVIIIILILIIIKITLTMGLVPAASRLRLWVASTQ